ncbi:MAG: hemolysin family protein [Bacteroidales bacterium]|jgi:CBS domain containing-hemolysin-like protein|nr:hemolysin family protein [Bacteroidales bacterium]
MEASIVISIISLLLMALFTALERSFATFNRLWYEVDKRQEKRYALLIEELLEREGELFSSLKLASGLFLVIFGISFAGIFPNMAIGLPAAILCVVIVTKVIPLMVATVNADFVMEHLVFVAGWVLRLFSPFIRSEKQTGVSEREESSEMLILQNALDFSEVKIRECMIPRTEICAISERASVDELLTLFAESKYSRIIIYSQDIDKITGYVHSKDLFPGGRAIKEIIREIDFVPEEMGARKLLATLIKNKRSIAVVNDEYGGTAGIVTLEDLIEEIFGEISDELDREDLIEKRISENKFIFSARLEIKHLNKTYDLNIPENEDYETLGGFITWFHENIPSEGEQLRYKNFDFSILKTSTNRVEKVSLTIIEEY